MDFEGGANVEPQRQPREAVDAEVAAAVRQLGSPNAVERDAALQAIRRMGPEKFEALATLLSAQQHTLQRCLRRGYVCKQVVFSVLVLLNLTLLGLALLQQNGGYIDLCLGGLFALLGGLIIVQIEDRSITRGYEAIASALTSIQDVRAVGLLLDALTFRIQWSDRIQVTALMTLLPRLQPEDKDLLTNHQRRQLCEMLKRSTRRNTWWFHDTLAVLILETLARIGDHRERFLVESLANGKARTAQAKRIQQAARACLPRLQEREAREDAPQTLLRSLESPSALPETLLRPAPEAAEIDSQQLLRLPHS